MKEKLRDASLPINGKKSELIERLNQQTTRMTRSKLKAIEDSKKKNPAHTEARDDTVSSALTRRKSERTKKKNDKIDTSERQQLLVENQKTNR